jgi:hypothetical protein
VILAAYGVALVAALCGAVFLAARVVRGRRRGLARPFAARGLLLCLSCLLGMALIEGAAASWREWLRRVPALPTRFPEPSPPGEVSILVLGESSAIGLPYDPWLSVGQIVGWQLEKVLPNRRVRIDTRAYGGAPLEPMLRVLAGLRRRPDVILVYSGHNEFLTRFPWSREVPYYDDDRGRYPLWSLSDRALRLSPFCTLIRETIDAHRISIAPPTRVNRYLVDRPACTAGEYARVRVDFGRRVDAIAAFAERVGVVPVLIVPAGNDGGFEPDRSYLAAATPAADRAAFARAFQAARAREPSDPAGAEAAYRELLGLQPGFAEAHFRLARLLEGSGRYDEARRHDERARDLDGYPMRCPTDLQDAYRAAAGRHGVLLVDGPSVLRRLGPHGLLDGHVLHDAQHPTYRSYLAIAQEVIDSLHARRALGWPEGTPPPVIDPADCAAHFGLDAPRWSAVAERTKSFYRWTAYVRFDPADRLAASGRFERAAAAIVSGTPPESSGVPGLGVHPADVGERHDHEGPRAHPTPDMMSASAAGRRPGPRR